MKTKWEVWAHLITVRYSYKALKKIAGWLSDKGIIDLPWSSVYQYTRGEEKSMGDFIEWYKNGKFECKDFPELPQYIEREYNAKMRYYARQAKHEIMDEIIDKL